MVNLYIIVAMILILAVSLLAMIFQAWINMPPGVMDFLQRVVAGPILAALLMAWKAWTPETEIAKTVNIITESTGSTSKTDI